MDNNFYRDILIQITKDLSELRKTKKELLKSDNQVDKVTGIKMTYQISSMTQLQDKLIIFLSILEHKSILELRDEFDFSY